MTSTTRRKPNPLRKWVGEGIEGVHVGIDEWRGMSSIVIYPLNGGEPCGLTKRYRESFARDIQRVLNKALKEARE